jgi:hypothetical protein
MFDPFKDLLLSCPANLNGSFAFRQLIAVEALNFKLSSLRGCTENLRNTLPANNPGESRHVGSPALPSIPADAKSIRNNGNPKYRATHSRLRRRKKVLRSTAEQ